jgi:predicted P-loop ATPase
MVGSTNKEQYLIDESGNRRYWPVHCEKADVEGIVSIRDQLWAEAVACFRAGEQWHLTPKLEVLAAIEQKRRMESHPWEEIILPFIEKLTDVSLKEIFDGPLHGRDRTPTAEKAVVKVLRGEGWLQNRTRKNNPNRVRRYSRPMPPHQIPK